MEVNEYLTRLPAPTRAKLLALPHCCLAVFRSLGDSERYALLRLVSGPQHVNTLTTLLQQNALLRSNEPPERRLFPALAALDVVVSEANGTMIRVDEAFSKNLKTALASLEPAGTRQNGDVDAAIPASVTAPSQADLIEYTKTCWENMLVPLLNTAFPGRFDRRQKSSISRKMLEVLSSSGLVNENETEVTNQGYHFLLSDIPGQVWSLIQNYIDNMSSGSDKTEAVSFLIFLATLPSGKLVSLSSLSEKEKALLIDWASLGIAMVLDSVSEDEMDVDTTPTTSRRRSSSGASQKKKAATQSATSGFFCPTPLAWQIVSSQREGLAGGTEIGKWKRGIIVESNFMLYAYTDSEILIALLDLFAEVSTRLPNLCIAQITRRSAREAFRRGISATRIIKYLQQNRHSVHLEKQRTAAAAAAARMLDRDAAILMGDDTLLRLEATGSIVGTGGDDAAEDDEDNRVHGLPEQVAEQIQLWEEERSRFQSCEGYMYDDFDNRAQYAAVEKYARDLGVLVWANNEKMAVFVLESAHEAMKAFIRKQASNS
eukprot:TRINITY_DN8379_c0_g1_i1.p1 TRINITY_DN8379_c0_g1~~TRINITY_DN8379_c0_g1_i1.p1  ORF type:complete len:544 (+),score=89.45 TRINITY_DN8379_c0_g1_i1:96-1727(+)